MPLNVRNMNIEQRGGTRREVDMGARDTLLTPNTKQKREAKRTHIHYQKIISYAIVIVNVQI